MKTFVTVVLLAVISVTKAEDEFIKAQRVFPPREGRFYYPTNPELTCKTSPPGTSYCVDSSSCNKGNKIFTCTDKFGFTEPVACAEPTPYCTGSAGFAKCTAFPDRYCETSSNYQCPGVGYFPDLYDCYTFYECYYNKNLKKLVSYQFRCSSGYPFSPDGKLDYKCSNTGKCIVPKCASTIAAEWVPMNYTNYGNIMTVYCLNGRPKYVYSCPPGLALNTASLYNSESPYCEVKCTRDLLRAPVISDNSRYYECRNGVAYQMPCSRERIFDPYTEQCIDKPFA